MVGWVTQRDSVINLKTTSTDKNSSFYQLVDQHNMTTFGILWWFWIRHPIAILLPVCDKRGRFTRGGNYRLAISSFPHAMNMIRWHSNIIHNVYAILFAPKCRREFKINRQLPASCPHSMRSRIRLTFAARFYTCISSVYVQRIFWYYKGWYSCRGLSLGLSMKRHPCSFMHRCSHLQHDLAWHSISVTPR